MNKNGSQITYFSLSTKLVEQAAEHVLNLLSDNLPPEFIFHNQRYTVQTVHAVTQISEAEEMHLHDRFILQIAAWFHHTGFINTNTHHRSESVRLMQEFMQRHEVDEDAINLVSQTIMHSASAWDATTSYDMILYDADWYFLSASNFKEMLERKKEEMVLLHGKLSPLEWSDFIDECFVKHKYLTNYGQEFLNNRRRINYFNYKKMPESEWSFDREQRSISRSFLS
ncbi:MAG: hypothetical protein HKN76_03315 [Saprospiraceae bacterium]|nr:hypothetical protein [Saprospiraceae bacterium]